ncbi:MAG TPA: prolyl aminopeptidase [Stellaceae bacterium]|nr:prolyl aminopeptidase [Stellaceae bacterium]
MYPPIEPFASGRLPAGPHELYWEQCGNPEGRPVVFLHGGPGSGASTAHRRFFDPAHYRIVLFDQRGAGRSTPTASLVDNTTPHLVADIESLRNRLGIERWLVFGGSWGSTLALSYGQAHPERCAGFVLRGIFLGTPREIDWFLHGIATIFPEVWHEFASFLPEVERSDLLGSYLRRLGDPDPEVHMPAARAWARYEGTCSTLMPSVDTVASFTANKMALGLARLEAHYMANGMFMPEAGLLAGVDRLRAIPATIVQGRYDVICPIRTADSLHRAWPEAEYVIVPDAGHSAMETGTRAQLVAATDRMRTAAKY